MSEAATAPAAAPGLAVVLADGEGQANILAKLLKQHIDAIVEADAGKVTPALKIRGKLGLHSTEPEAEATLAFDGARVLIKNGMEADCDGRITGPLKLQTEMLVGVANPYREMLRRTLMVSLKLPRPLFTSTTYSFLKAPPSLRPQQQAAE